MLSTRREFLGLAGASAALYVANRLGITAEAAVTSSDGLAARYLKYVDWKPLTINSVAAAEGEFHFQGIPYRDLAEVAAIHGKDPYNPFAFNPAMDPNNWEWVEGPEGDNRFAARLKPDSNFNDIQIFTDASTVVEGYQLLADPAGANGIFREQRIVVGPGQRAIWVKGILVRRDKFPDSLYKFVLSQRTAKTVDENQRNGTNHTVIGIDGTRGPGDLSVGVRKIQFLGGLDEVARSYGGNFGNWEWVSQDEIGYAARLNYTPASHWLPPLDVNTVVEGKQSLWSPTSTREQRFVVAGIGQNGIYLINGTFRRDWNPNVLYKYILGTKTANTIVENNQNGTNIIVIGVNGFRGGEN